ncbi:DinB family protein [Daejeonella sp.]|jgi:hypothetical protein|uniref:DinB family protein n=1 Tax=Daejeonella sp. TaxID=2805397 RepID=UPI0037BF7D9E
MSLERSYQSLLNAVVVYENLLEEISEEVFQKNPEDESWSYSETYSHIFSSGLLSLTAIQTCIEGKGIISRKPIFWAARLILFFGTFPPGKIKAPKRIAALAKKITKKEAEDLLVKFKTKLAETQEQIQSADPNQKVEHPRLKLLNALQWLRFIEVHTLHHIKQLKRIKKAIAH